MNRKLIVLPLMALLGFLVLPVSVAALELNSQDEGGSGNFEAEYLAASGSQVGVLILHGRGGHPDGAVVRDLRRSMNRLGYSTLSIANPVPANGDISFASYVSHVSSVMPEAYARIRTGLNYLAEQGVTKAVIMGFSLGSRFSAAHFANGRDNEIPLIGFIGVGVYATNINPLNPEFTLSGVDVPFLDLYGDHDQNAVNTATSRTNAYQSGSGPSHSQVVLDCNDELTINECHKLVGLIGDDGKPAEQVIAAWLACHAPLNSQSVCADLNTVASKVTVSVPDSGSGGGGALTNFGLLMALFGGLFGRRFSKS